MKYIICAWAFLLSSAALSYPETVRHGYNGSCISCHVSPTGGGAVKAYGRMVNEELTTWSPKGYAEMLFGALPLPERVALGGDFRYVNVKTAGYARSFVMQNDFELGLQLSNEVWIDGSIGDYGEAKKRETRRSFILWQPYEMVALRVGKFIPAYGLNLPDHTTSVRRIGLGQGSETINAELSTRFKYGELFVTGASPKGTSITLGERYGFHAERTDLLVRASGFIGQTLQLGASYWQQEQEDASLKYTFGSHAMWGATKKLYLLAEADRVLQYNQRPRDVSYTELGYEVWRGVHVQATHEYIDGNLPGVGLQWFPLPHIELLARAKYKDDVWATQLMAHLNW